MCVPCSCQMYYSLECLQALCGPAVQTLRPLWQHQPTPCSSQSYRRRSPSTGVSRSSVHHAICWIC